MKIFTLWFSRENVYVKRITPMELSSTFTFTIFRWKHFLFYNHPAYIGEISYFTKNIIYSICCGNIKDNPIKIRYILKKLQFYVNETPRTTFLINPDVIGINKAISEKNRPHDLRTQAGLPRVYHVGIKYSFRGSI